MSTPVYADKDLQGRELKNLKLESQTTSEITAATKYAGGLKYDSTKTKIVGCNNGTSYDSLATETYADSKATTAETNANTYTDGKVTIINSELENKQVNFPGISRKTPILPSDISINYTTRTLTITKESFEYTKVVEGVATRYKKTGPIVFPAWSNTTGVKFFYFDGANPIVSETPWAIDGSKVFVYRILWTALATEPAAEAYECHQDTLSSDAHDWFHNYGAVWKGGHDLICTPVTGNTVPNPSGVNTVVGMTTGTYCDDNINIVVTNCFGATPTNKFEQDLGITTAGSLAVGTGAMFAIKQDVGGGYGFLPATRFPFDFTDNIPNYITTTGARVPITDPASAGLWFVYFAYELSDPRPGLAIKLVSAPISFATEAEADAYLWEDVQGSYPTLKDNEIRVLYKFKFQYKSTFDNAIKRTALRGFIDLRKSILKQDALAGGSVPASNVVVTPSGNLSSTNLQSALYELQTDIDTINYGSVAAGEDIALGDFICIKDGLAYKANATDNTKMDCCGISTAIVLTGATVIYLKRGAWTFLAAHGFTIDSGVPIFVSATLSGKGTTTPPSVNLNKRQILGFATSSTAIEFNPNMLSLTYYE
jgi:hypothetical protein